MFVTWPLRKRLIAVTAVLTALAGFAIGAATLIGVRSYMVGQLDEELMQATSRQHFVDRDHDRDQTSPLDGPGTAVGTVLVAFNTQGNITATYLNAEANARAFTPVNSPESRRAVGATRFALSVSETRASTEWRFWAPRATPHS